MTLSTGGSRQLTLKYKGAWGGSFRLLSPCYMPSTGLIALKAPPLLILTGISGQDYAHFTHENTEAQT